MHTECRSSDRTWPGKCQHLGHLKLPFLILPAPMPSPHSHSTKWDCKVNPINNLNSILTPHFPIVIIPGRCSSPTAGVSPEGQPEAANTVLSKCPLGFGSSCLQLEGRNPYRALKFKVSLSTYHCCQAPVRLKLITDTHG